MSRIRIEQLGITKAGTECIVNAANENLQAGGGVCGVIFQAAGHKQLQKACDDIGYCNTGSAVITPAFHLNAKYIIHAVGPVWYGGKKKESQKLYGCYKASLNLAKDYGCHSIAFPLISAGIFGYPKDQAWRKALQACNDFIHDNPDYDMDILFTIPDPQILQMGLAELKAQEKNTDTHQETNSVDETTDDDLLANADGNALRIAIDAVKSTTEAKWHTGRETNGVMEFPYPEYPNGIWSIASIFESDSEYLENYKQYCEDVLSTEMNVRQIRTMLTYLVRGEKYCDGFINKYLENHYLLKLLLRLDDLLIDYYQRHQLPVELRYKNPVFWYEMDQNGTPALVKGNGERFTTDRSNEMYERSCQSQQGWQRAILYMDMIHEWDATGFAATMDATYAYGPDEDDNYYTFTSCQKAEEYLYRTLGGADIQECRSNVENFYADPKLQMEWKEIILHPVCVVLRKNGSLTPMLISRLNSDILIKYPQHVMRLDDESCRFLFEKMNESA
ncbi:macro domain-containing protein [Bulleidia sp. HCP3S3_F2]|uniref:macro domain-containing protein n=1 Tax=unclassified Bulleidia TaxID=2704656 RepID=UPI003F8BF94F